MNLVLDAVPVINLINGGGIGLILSLENRYFIGSYAYDECISIAQNLDHLIDNGDIYLFDGSDVSASEYIAMLDKYKLGAGETECLLLCQSLDMSLCSDDKRARNLAKDILGSSRVTGSLGLLREAVSKGFCTSQDAYSIYSEMKRQGAFLPSVDLEYFN